MGILKIAICDDSDFFVEQIQGIVCDHLQTVMPTHEICTYCDGTTLVDEYTIENKFDIIFMDYLFEGSENTGISMIRRLREIDESVIVCFVSNYERPAIEAIELGTFRYILKDEDMPEKICTALDKAIKSMNLREHLFTFKSPNGYTSVAVGDIFFIRQDNRIVSIHSWRSQYISYQSLKKIERELSKHFFVRCHNSYLVNMQKIRWYTSDSLFLSTGVQIPISQNRRKDFVEEFKKYSYLMM